MSQLDRRIAGLTCAEVLAELSPLLDGELSAARVRELQAHLRDCRECDSFGTLVGRVIEQLRAGAVPSVPDAVRGRVHERVQRIIRSSA